MASCPVCEKTYEDHTAVCPIDGATLLRDGPAPDPFLGKVIKGRYRVLSKLGQGGMGAVYLAEQVAVSRNVALKILQGYFAQDKDFVKRFRLEAHLAASLNHRNVITIYDFDQADEGSLFIAMEYLNGRTLSDLVRQDGPMPVGRAVHLSLQIAEGLRAAHQAGVIHRDVKPQNIMVLSEGDGVKLLDFGIARMLDAGEAGLTRTGVMMGTPAYMAPEQIEGGEITEQTDIYAFGIVLYEMLTGSVPFTAATPSAVLTKHLRESPRALSTMNPAVPRNVEQVVMKALEKDPNARPRNMAAVIAGLVAAGGYVPSAAFPEAINAGDTVANQRSPGGQAAFVANLRTLESSTASLPAMAVGASDASSGATIAVPPVTSPPHRPSGRWTFVAGGVGLLALVGAAGVALQLGVLGRVKETLTPGMRTSTESPAPQSPAPQTSAPPSPAPQSSVPQNVLKSPRSEPTLELKSFQAHEAMPQKRDATPAPAFDKNRVGADQKPKPTPESVKIASPQAKAENIPNADAQAQPKPEPDVKQPQAVVTARLGPDEILRQVEQKLRAGGFEKMIRVNIDPDYTVTLMGGLESKEMKEEVLRLASSVGGVRSVNDRIMLMIPGSTKKVQ